MRTFMNLSKMTMLVLLSVFVTSSHLVWCRESTNIMDLYSLHMAPKEYPLLIDDCTQLLESTTDKNGQSGILNNRAIAYTHLGLYAQALSDYDKAALLHPGDNNNTSARTRLNSLINKTDYENCLLEKSQNPESIYIDQTYLHDQDAINKLSKTIDDLSRKIDEFTKSRPSNILKGTFVTGQHYKDNFDLARALAFRGMFYSNIGKFQEAITDCNNASKMAPNLWTPYNTLTRIYLNLKEPSKVLDNCNKLIKGGVDKDFSAGLYTYFYQAQAYGMLGNNERYTKAMDKVRLFASKQEKSR